MFCTSNAYILWEERKDGAVIKCLLCDGLVMPHLHCYIGIDHSGSAYIHRLKNTDEGEIPFMDAILQIVVLQKVVVVLKWFSA